MKEKRNRITYLDIARGIGIILMVCGHADNVGKIEAFVGLFHMALFIFISGYLFKDENFNNFKSFIKHLIKKVSKLYIFYLKYELLFYGLKNLFFKIGFLSSSISYYGKDLLPISSIEEVIKNVILIFIGFGREPFCGAFWFIISLIFIIIMYSSICYFSRKQKIIPTNIFKFISVIIIFMIGAISAHFKINIPRLMPACSLILMFYLGEINRKYNKISFNNTIICLVSILSLIILKNFGGIGINSNGYTNVLYYIICSLSGIYAIMYISKKIDNSKNIISKILIYIGQNTLAIIAWHFIAFKAVMLLQIALRVISFNDLALLTGCNNNNIWYIGYIIAGVALPLLINFGINKLIKLGGKKHESRLNMSII